MFIKNHPQYFFTSDNFRIFYNTNFELKKYDPKKPTLVFIYGLLCSNEHFRYQIPFFDNLGFQILIHDYRFHFASTQDGSLDQMTFKDITRDLHELLTDLKLKNIILIGHSMGVNICLEHAVNYPQDLDKMVIISGTVVPPQDVMFNSNIMDIASPYIQKLLERFPELHEKIWTTSYMNPLAQFLVFDGGFNTKTVPLDFVQMYMKKIGELRPDLFFHLLQMMHDHDVILHLEEIKATTLVIGGDKDKIIPNYLQKMLIQKIENSVLYIVKDGSHVPQADFPELVNERLLHFIEEE